MSDTRVVTGKVRFSYLHVFEKHSVDGDNEKDGKYSVSLLIDKDDKKTLKAIQSAIEAATAEGKKDKFGGRIPKNLKTPLRDGDDERPDDEAYENMMFINCSSNRRPGLVGPNPKIPITDEEELYSGCYGRAAINFFAFNVSGNKGIAAGLNNLQKLEEGEPLSGGRTALEDFGDGEFDDYEEDDDLM